MASAETFRADRRHGPTAILTIRVTPEEAEAIERAAKLIGPSRPGAANSGAAGVIRAAVSFWMEYSPEAKPLRGG